MNLLFALADLSAELKQQYRRFPAKDSTLDIDFINNRQRVAGIYGAALDGVTFTRSTTGTYFDATGTMQTAAINAPRFEYDPVLLRPLGLLIEESRANLLLNADTGVTQNVTVSATPYTLSFWGTGTVTLSGVSTAGPLVGTGANTRVTQTFTPTAGPLTLTVSGTVSKWQLEAGAFATSYISTGGTSATRGADVGTMSGVNFTNWYNPAEGTLILFQRTNNPSSAAYSAVIRDAAGALQGGIGMYYSSNSTVAAARVRDFNAGHGSAITTRSVALGARCIAAMGYTAANATASASIDGSGTVTGTGAPPPASDTLFIGSNPSSLNALNGHIERIIYIPKRLPNNVLQYLSRATA